MLTFHMTSCYIISPDMLLISCDTFISLYLIYFSFILLLFLFVFFFVILFLKLKSIELTFTYKLLNILLIFFCFSKKNKGRKFNSVVALNVIILFEVNSDRFHLNLKQEVTIFSSLTLFSLPVSQF